MLSKFWVLRALAEVPTKALLSKLAIREVDPTSLMANLDKSGFEGGSAWDWPGIAGLKLGGQ